MHENPACLFCLPFFACLFCLQGTTLAFSLRQTLPPMDLRSAILRIRTTLPTWASCTTTKYTTLTARVSPTLQSALCTLHAVLCTGLETPRSGDATAVCTLHCTALHCTALHCTALHCSCSLHTALAGACQCLSLYSSPPRPRTSLRTIDADLRTTDDPTAAPAAPAATAVLVQCGNAKGGSGSKLMTEAEFQASGADPGTTVHVTPEDDVIIGWAKAILEPLRS